MSLASELLQSTGKRRGSDRSWEGWNHPLRHFQVLDEVVYGLLAEHDTPWHASQRSRADLRIMYASGQLGHESVPPITQACERAALVVAELSRLLPRCKE